MKIAILTLPLHSNYGGIMQAYALQQVLQRMGHDVATIDLRGQSFYSMKPIDKLRRTGSFMKCLVRKYILRAPNVHLSNPLGTDYRPFYPNKEIDKFIKKHICTSRKIQGLDDFRNYIASHSADAYIVGSDQVWRAWLAKRPYRW